MRLRGYAVIINSKVSKLFYDQSLDRCISFRICSFFTATFLTFSKYRNEDFRMSRIDNKLIFLVYKEFFSLASYSRVMDTHFVGEIHKTNHSHWKFLFYYLKCITSRLVIHSSIHCTRDRNSSFHIPNYTKPAQIEAVKMITYIFFGHLQALCSNIKVMKANKLRITTQCTNCENHMADQDHMTHTTGVQRGQGQQTVIYTPPSYGCKIERFLINIVYFKNYQPAI